MEAVATSAPLFASPMIVGRTVGPVQGVHTTIATQRLQQFPAGPTTPTFGWLDTDTATATTSYASDPSGIGIHPGLALQTLVAGQMARGRA
jgi:hypothetical protein